MVVDKVDEVEQSTSQLIDSKVEEVKMPIVESVDELEKLELAKGRVAAVEKTGESTTVKISDCYLSYNWEEDWDKYTIVKGVEEKDVIIDKDVAASVMFSASKETIDKDALQVSVVSGIFYYVKWADEPHVTSLEEVNKALSSGKYRAIFDFNEPEDCFIDDYFTFYLEKPQPSLYIKGDSWERLAKESDLGGNVAIIYANEESTRNTNAYNTIIDCYENEKPYVAVVKIDDMLYSANINIQKVNDRYIIMAQCINTAYNKFYGVLLGLSVETGVGLANLLTESELITIDSELSDTSENAVQNKVVTKALGAKQNTIPDLETIRSGAAKGTTALQSVPSTYATKTDVDNAIANAITTTLNTEV